MSIIEFKEKFVDWLIIPKVEIEKEFPNYSANSLTRWQKKGYIQKVRNGFYRLLNNKIKGDGDLFFIANRLYFPSYVSLQSALSLYGFIPEGVFSITSISTRINRKFETPIGDFIYKNLREDLYFGFTLHKTGQFYYRLATPEKAVLDFLYLYPQYKDAADMEGLRWNIFEIDEKFDFKLAEQYLKIYDSAALSRRYAIFVDFVKNEL